MSELVEKMNNLLQTSVSSRHSYFQLKYFLIGKEPTNQSKMWQCLRELKSRQETLDSIDLQIEEENDKLELCKLNISRIEKTEKETTDELDSKELTIKKRQINRAVTSTLKNIESLKNKKKDTEEECEFFVETFKNIEKIEPLKNFDDLDSQKDYWGTKLLEKINLRILLQKNVDTELIETALALPDDTPIKQQVINKLNYLQNNILKSNNEFMGKIGNNQ